MGKRSFAYFGGGFWGRHLIAVGAALLSSLSQAQLHSAISHSVSPAGAATIKIPIDVAPGVVALQPNIAIAYSSQAGDGILGLGWSLTGMSFIARCPQSITSDGAKSAINYTASDRFCLDGERLTLVSGTYGGNGSEYRLEIEKFKKINSYGVAGTGPASFTVKTRDGLLLEYGGTTDSRIEASGKTSIRVWALNKITDESGNFNTYTYTKNSTTGSFYLSRIDYTANGSGVAALSSVAFSYETKPDWLTRYSGGSALKADQRLKQVLVSSAAAPGQAQSALKSYAFTYAVSPLGGASRLQQVKECDGSGSACLPPINVTWDTDYSTNSLTRVSGIVRQGYFPGNAISLVADVNGDGLEDIVVVGIGTYKNNGNGTYSFISWSGTAVNYYSTTSKVIDSFAADMNGDGKTDIVVVWGACPGGTYGCTSFNLNVDVLLNQDANGKFGGSTWIAFGSVNDNAYKVVQPADYDGDGRPDIAIAKQTLVMDPSCSTCYTQGLNLYTYRNTGTGMTLRDQYIGGANSWPTNGQFVPYDVDGDGTAEIVSLIDTNLYATFVKYKNGGGSVLNASSMGTFNMTNGTGQWCTADVNGDGLIDWVRTFSDSGSVSIDVFVNQGGSYQLQRWATRSGAWNSGSQLFCRDVSGDGAAEVMRTSIDASGKLQVDVYAPNNNAFTSSRWLSGDAFIAGHWMSTDVKGDGSAGMAVAYNDGGYVSIATYLPQLQTHNQVASVDTLGNSFKFIYDSTSRMYGVSYFKDIAPAFPKTYYSAPIRVVSSLQESTGFGGGDYRETKFQYGSALYDQANRTFLGFNWMESLDTQSTLVSRLYFRQDFPYIGRVSAVGLGTSHSNWNNIKSVVKNLSCTDFVSASGCVVAPGRRYAVFDSQIDEQLWDLTGSPISRTRTFLQFDAYGNEKVVDIHTLNADGTESGYVTTTSKIYAIDVPNWRINKLVRSTVTNTTP